MLFFPAKPNALYYGADYAITDLSTGKFHYGREPFILGRPETTGDGFRLRADHARAAGGGGHDDLRFEVDGWELELSVEATKDAVLEFGDGTIQGYCNDLYAYSRPRMSARGALTRAGASVSVVGTATFSRARGFNPAFVVLGWDFLTLELDDGRDILLATGSLRKGGNEISVEIGSISDADGNVTPLHRGDFEITPVRFWQRDATCAYPVEWDVEVQGLRLHASARIDGAEVRAVRWPQAHLFWPEWPLYWDGPAVVSGDATGRGWLDLGRYCAF